MAEGYRVTEDGQPRVTESLDLRITEQFAPLYATSTLDAVATQYSVAGILLGVSSSLVGALSELSAVTFTAGAVALLEASASVTAEAEWAMNLIATLASSGTTSALLGYLLEGSAAASATGVVDLQPSIIRDVSHSGSASLSLDCVPTYIASPVATFGSQGSTTAFPTYTASATSQFTSQGTVTGTANVKVEGLTNIQSNSVFTIYPQLLMVAAALEGGTGTITAYGGFLAKVASDLAANGLLNGTVKMILSAEVMQGQLRRVTESGDVRITSTGEFRSVTGANNLGSAYLESVATATQFSQGLKGKINGSWGNVTARVKRGGSWVTPKVYVKDNDTWKRVY